ncbi:MAG: DNA polymerase III subunit chi [Sphingomonadales bacterium]
MLVDFYHLGTSPLERVLPRIGERLLETGERLLVVAGSPQLAQIDGQLWTYARDSFLPHGLAEGANADRQPILLSEEPVPLNAARNVALADGQWRDEALTFERAFYFFDAARIDDARASWRRLSKQEGVECRYWKQDDKGKWVQGP